MPQLNNSTSRDNVFEDAKCYAICILDAEDNQKWVTIETTLDVLTMGDDELQEVLSHKGILCANDRFFFANPEGMEKFVI